MSFMGCPHLVPEHYYLGTDKMVLSSHLGYSIGNCSVADLGGGGGSPGSPKPPPPTRIRHDACWRVKFLHTKDHISLFIKFSTLDNAFLAF